MEKITEICLCHGEEWGSRVELLRHQLGGYQRQQESIDKEVVLSRTAVAQAGGDPETLLRERKQLKEAGRNLQKEKIRFTEEKERAEHFLQLEISRTQERVVAMEAWEVRLGHREAEAQDAEFRCGYEFPGT